MSSARLTRCTDLQDNDADDTPLEVPVGEKDTRKNIYSEHVTQKSNMYWSCLAVMQYLFRIMHCIHMAIYIRVRYVFFVQVDGAMCTCFCHLFFSRRFLHGTASLYQPLLRRHAIVVIMIAFLVVAMTRDIKQHIIKKMVPIPCACSGSDYYSIWIFLRGDPRFLSTWFAVHTVWAFCK